MFYINNSTELTTELLQKLINKFQTNNFLKFSTMPKYKIKKGGKS